MAYQPPSPQDLGIGRLFRVMPDAAVVTDVLDGRVALWNPGAERLFGYPAEEAIGRCIAAFLPERLRAALLADLAHLRAGGASPLPAGQAPVEFAIVRADGAEVPVEGTNAVLEQAGGERRYILSVLRDASARKRAEERLAESQRIAHLGSWEWDIAADDVTWSDELYRIYGLSPATFTANLEGFLARVHPADRDRVREEIRAAYREARPFDVRHRIIRPDGAVRALHARGAATTDAAGRVVRLAGTGQDVTEQPDVAARARLAAIVESSEDAIIGKTLDAVVTDWNPGAERLYGYSAAEMIGRPIARLIPPDRPAELADIMARLRRGERIEMFETVRVRKDGSHVGVSIAISPIRDARGELVGAATIARDTTAHRHAVERATRLHAVTAGLSAALTPQRVAAVVIEQGVGALGAHAGSVFLADPAAGQARLVGSVGYPHDLVGRWRSFPLDGPTLVARTIRTGQALWLESIESAVDDSPRAAAIRALMGPGALVVLPLAAPGRVLGTLGLHFATPRHFDADERDFMLALAGQCAQALERATLYETERAARAQAEALYGAALAISAESGMDARLQRVLDAALALAHADVAGISLVDGPNGEAAMVAVRGDVGDLLGRRIPRGQGLTGAVLTTGRPVRVDDLEADPRHRLRDWSTERGLHSWLGVPLHDERGVHGVLALLSRAPGYFNAEHERRLGPLAALAGAAIREARLREELEAALRARDEFLSIASHELKTPVTGIKGFAQNLLRARAHGNLDDTRLERGLHTINEASDRLAALTNDLLDVARIRLGRMPFRPRPVDLAALVRESAERFREQLDERHACVLDGADAPLLAPADPERLDQVLDNLLDNARKYSPHGGTILVRLAEHDGGVLLEVRDAGIGLTPGSEEAIFIPFGRSENAARSHIAGMGLGLHISRSIVELHGGRMWATSPGEGRGATLSAWLPLDPAAQSPAM